MIRGGIATIYVSDMQRAVDFYAGTLGLPLVLRAGDHWAEVAVGGLRIGLHPASEHSPVPGTPGAISIGLGVDEPLPQVVAALRERGVTFENDALPDDGGVTLAFFADPDGNPLYLVETSGT